MRDIWGLFSAVEVTAGSVTSSLMLSSAEFKLREIPGVNDKLVPVFISNGVEFCSSAATANPKRRDTGTPVAVVSATFDASPNAPVGRKLEIVFSSSSALNNNCSKF